MISCCAPTCCFNVSLAHPSLGSQLDSLLDFHCLEQSNRLCDQHIPVKQSGSEGVMVRRVFLHLGEALKKRQASPHRMLRVQTRTNPVLQNNIGIFPENEVFLPENYCNYTFFLVVQMFICLVCVESIQKKQRKILI